MPHIITITGASGAGKSTTLDYLVKLDGGDFKPEIITKFTTRSPHADDSDEVLCVDAIPDQCDLIYEQYGDRYGVELKSLFSKLAKGISPIIILNDIRAVEDVRNYWKELVRSVYIFRRSPELKNYEELAQEREVSEDEENPVLRYQKAIALYRIYIENIHLFDHVIVNSGTRRDLRNQVEQIVEGLMQSQNWPLREVK